MKGCPKSAIGFDFDGARFTHVDSKVTFEVLISSFSLRHDAGLARLGTLVHHLDVGGIAIAEGPGFATVMAEARSLQQEDNAALLKRRLRCSIICTLGTAAPKAWQRLFPLWYLTQQHLPAPSEGSFAPKRLS